MTAASQMLDRHTLEQRIRAVRLLVFDFDGVFTDNMVYVFEDATEAVRCFRSDGLGLSKLKRLALDMVILSTETNPVVSARARKLGLPCVQGVEDKRAALEQLASKKELEMSEIAFVGNDINDLPCLEIVHLAIVVQDAHPDVISRAHYQTRTPGGHGAVREVCDLFARVKGAA